MDDLISRQAAIKAVYDLPNCYNGYSDTYDKAWIIGLLGELPSAQPEPIKINIDHELTKDEYEKLRKDMADAPIVLLPTAEPRKGKWERHYSRPNVYADLFWHCSECGYKNDENYAPVYHHFCPNCGARMEESDE